MSSIIRDIEITNAAGFIEHSTEAAPIIYNSTKERTEYSTTLLPNISWTIQGEDVHPLAYYIGGHYGFFVTGTRQSLVDPPPPMTMAVPQFLLTSFEYVAATGSYAPFTIRVSLQSGSPDYYQIENVTTGNVISTTTVSSGTYILPQCTGTARYVGNNQWYVYFELIMYQQNPDTGVWNMTDKLWDDYTFVDAAGTTIPVEFNTFVSTLTARRDSYE